MTATLKTAATLLLCSAQVLAGVPPVFRDGFESGAGGDAKWVAGYYVGYERGLNAWDHAAGGLVATEAGLTGAGLSGAATGPEMVVAAPPALFAPLHDRLVELDAAGGP